MDRTGSFGGETWGWGGGVAFGTPGWSVSISGSYFWDMGPISFNFIDRKLLCRCEIDGTLGRPAGSVPLNDIEAMARHESESLKTVVKAKLKVEFPSGASAIDRVIDNEINLKLNV